MGEIVSFEHPDAARARVDRERDLAKLKEANDELAQERTEDYTLLSKIGEEFAGVDTFTLDDVNDTYGDYTEGGMLFTQDHLQKYIDEGFLQYSNEDADEYFLTELGKEEADRATSEYFKEAA